MTFSGILPRTKLYIDANIFVYASNGTSEASRECRDLLERCGRREFEAFIGTHVLLEVAHRLMMIEAVDKGLVSPGSVPRKLKRRPELASQLNSHSDAIRFILNTGIYILQVDADILELSANLREQTGFLVNDSISLAMMERHDIRAIATNDRDFQRVADLEVLIPSDL